MTGFDAPSVSTVYLDRPMRNHTLMQTIARANRVFPEKDNGLDRRLRRCLPEPGEGAGDLRCRERWRVPDRDHRCPGRRAGRAVADLFAFCSGRATCAMRDAEGSTTSPARRRRRGAARRRGDPHRLPAEGRQVRKLFKALLPDPAARPAAQRRRHPGLPTHRESPAGRGRLGTSRAVEPARPVGGPRSTSSGRRRGHQPTADRPVAIDFEGWPPSSPAQARRDDRWRTAAPAGDRLGDAQPDPVRLVERIEHSSTTTTPAASTSTSTCAASSS